jgi:hypothetical protein
MDFAIGLDRSCDHWYSSGLDMFLRESTQSRVRGDRITHLQLAESVWNPTTQRTDTRILCMPVKAGNEISEEVLTRPGRYRSVAPNLEVKEVLVGDGERRRRYIVCYNAEEAKRQQAHHTQVVAELDAVLPALRTAGAQGKRVCALRTSERYGKYLTQDRHGRLKLDPGKLRQAERFDGKFAVHSNDDTLTPEDLALGYKQLMHVERACGDTWRTIRLEWDGAALGADRTGGMASRHRVPTRRVGAGVSRPRSGPGDRRFACRDWPGAWVSARPWPGRRRSGWGACSARWPSGA